MTDTNAKILPALDRAALKAIIKARSFSQGTNVTLASGRASTFYFDMKPTMLDPNGAVQVALAMADIIAPLDADYVGGLAMGAVPIVSSIAPVSAIAGAPIEVFFVRKEAKGHGAQRQIEGLAAGETLEGKKVVIVEDVTTTGGSALQAVEVVRAAGGTVADIVTIVDREEGAEANLTPEGITLHAVFKASEFKD
ncbi:MAG: orotate phosphoribosyltransferase [Hyphomicrobiales bacterium]|nr:MAG: orotate phosphoribosyltransferase [Hyphomicrobiales bacterium]